MESLDPVDTFALMEDAAAADLCYMVDTNMAAIKKVRSSSSISSGEVTKVPLLLERATWKTR